MLRVKYVIIDRRNRSQGTYKVDTHEEVLEGMDWTQDEEDPTGALGLAIHDREGFGRRFFVKVLGVERW
jgi:hypothetical protein